MPTPHVIISTAMSIDSCIDDASPERLMLSHALDWEAVDTLRASVDAILVGAGTLRSDNPSLRIRSQSLVDQRVASGARPFPAKVTLTASGDLDPELRFFRCPHSEKFVFCPDEVHGSLEQRVGTLATVFAAGESSLDPARILSELSARGIERVLIEGGTAVNTMFLTAGLVDELRLSIAPLFVGDRRAPRFVDAGTFPHDATRRMHLQTVEQCGDCAVLHYRLERCS